MKERKINPRRVILSCLLVIGLLSIFSLVHTPQTASAATKAKTTSSTKYPYLIKVNKKMNTVTIYKKDAKGKYTIPVKAMICSTGKDTPIGTFRTKAKYRWKWLLHDVYGQYSTRITGSILFHSVYYYKLNPSTLATKEFNKLGTQASMGCVRLQVVDAKWIYDHCGLGTTVVIYNSNNPGPLGKPKAIKLGKNTRWDPTDTTNKKNPYNKKKPTIKGAKNKTIAYGSTFDPKKGVTAYNTCDYNITKELKVTGKVNTKVAGDYKLTYSVKDELKRTQKKTITITVKPKKGMPTIHGVSDQVYSYKIYKDIDIKALALKGISATVGNQKLGKSYLKYTIKKEINDSSMVRYLVTYTVKNGTKTAKKQAYITLDKQAPVILGVQDLTLTKEEFEVLKDKIAHKEYPGITFNDNCTEADKLWIKVIIDQKKDKTYTITYQVSDEAGLTTQMKATIHIAD